jgi:NAD(P)H-dependent flavin oxidoreductase YrpB (nitropropane dioxygenase family)
MSVATPVSPAVAIRALPVVIQGGMGVAVSSWRLARAVSRTGQLGVVSGTALDVVLARRLQDGDQGGDIRRALERFPMAEIAERVLTRYFRAQGRPAGRPYLPVPRLSLRPRAADQQLSVVANFVEVWLAKEGHDGLVGINFLEKVQMATPAAAYGAMLAGVDYVLMGAGIPTEIPQLLDRLARHEVGRLNVHVDGATTAYTTEFEPATLTGQALPTLQRPKFLAIVSAHVLAAYLARDDGTRPDGFVIEGPTAGGHNAPPRGRMTLDEAGQPVYGPRDRADLAQVAALGLPFWLAGSSGTPEQVSLALAAGAAGVQVGTLFALSAESGLTGTFRDDLLSRLDGGTLQVRTDALASPTGFPFKVATLPGTLSEASVYADRPRLCDLGYLRVPYERKAGGVGYRCPGEPVQAYVRKGGAAQDTVGRKCLCNSLTANVGLGQTRRGGYAEAPLVTLGADLDGARQLLKRYPGGWTAREAVVWLLGAVPRT